MAILAGGTGLYLRAVARGLDTSALPSDPVVRARLERELETDGLAALVERLQRLAPRTATQVDLPNPRRVVRALEIVELQGDVPRPRPRGYPAPVTWLGLRLDQPLHDERIAVRTDAQFRAGLIDEADALRRRFDPGLPAFTAIGYREAWAVLDGSLDKAAARDLVAQRTRAFARRQNTWFRSEPDIEWHPGDVTAATLLTRVQT